MHFRPWKMDHGHKFQSDILWNTESRFLEHRRLRQVVSLAWHKRCFEDTTDWNVVDVHTRNNFDNADSVYVKPKQTAKR